MLLFKKAVLSADFQTIFFFFFFAKNWIAAGLRNMDEEHNQYAETCKNRPKKGEVLQYTQETADIFRS